MMQEMMIRNNTDLQTAYQKGYLASFCVTDGAENVIRDSLQQYVSILMDAYGENENGRGGYIKLVPENIHTDEGKRIYQAELEKYHLNPELWEFDDCLVESDKEEVCLQLFAMTEYNLLILYIRNREGD